MNKIFLYYILWGSLGNMCNIEFEPVKIRKELDVLNDTFNEDDLFIDILNHRGDVEKVMYHIADYLEEIGEWHDWTKLEYFEEFKDDCIERLSEEDFKKRDWYNIHTIKERHHVNANCPEDVNLFDILEMIADCIIAGKSRSGVVNNDYLELNDGILERAYWNTVKFLSDNIVVNDE